jgi:hypothetical protein
MKRFLECWALITGLVFSLLVLGCHGEASPMPHSSASAASSTQAPPSTRSVEQPTKSSVTL